MVTYNYSNAAPLSPSHTVSAAGVDPSAVWASTLTPIPGARIAPNDRATTITAFSRVIEPNALCAIQVAASPMFASGNGKIRSCSSPVLPKAVYPVRRNAVACSYLPECLV